MIPPLVVPYLYEHGRTICSRSFREQRSWFEKHNSFDPVYTKILADHTQWFEELAGKAPSGLRDVIVHRGGTYQFGWTNPSDADEFKLHAGIVSAGRYVENDVIAALKRMTQGWCEFLDKWWHHFTMKLSPVVSWADIGRDDLARYISCNGNERPSFWIYPRAS